MKKLRVGILGAQLRSARIIASFYEALPERFELYLQSKDKGNFNEVGIFDVLWICDSYNSKRQFERNLMKVLIEYNPLLCILAVRTKPYMTQKIQKKLKLMNLQNIKIVYAPLFCSTLMKDWDRYIRAFPMLIGYDEYSSWRLARIHMNEIGFRCHPVHPSVNLELGKLLIDSTYLLYNYWEQEKKRIIRKIESKDQTKLLESINEIFQVYNIALVEAGRQDYRLPNLDLQIFLPEALKKFFVSSPIKLQGLRMIRKSNRLMLQTKVLFWKYWKAQIKYLYLFCLSRYNLIKGRIAMLLNFSKKKNVNKLQDNLSGKSRKTSCKRDA